MRLRTATRARLLGVAVLAALGTVVAHANASAGSVRKHPAHNIAAKPDYRAACSSYHSNSATCIREALAAINRARGMEHVRPMILPDNFTKLTVAEQTFVVSDLERADRGLKPFRGLTAKLNKTAQQAAVAHADPAPAYSAVGGFVVMDYSSNWTNNFGPLAGNYGWMYDDGYGSYNIDCTTPAASGCWAHRDVILTHYDKPSLITGVGSDKRGGLVSIAQLFVAGSGQRPAFTYTWRQAVKHGAGGSRYS